MLSIVEFNQALAGALTPITLISGVGLLMICMTNRYNHATNRIRQLMAKRDTSEARFEPDIDAEIEIIYLRASLLRRGVLSVATSAVFSALLVTVSVCSRFFDIDLSALEGITLVAAITLIVVSACFSRQKSDSRSKRSVWRSRTCRKSKREVTASSVGFSRGAPTGRRTRIRRRRCARS